MGTRQVGHRPDGGSDLGFTHERDGIDRDALSTQVVAIALADCPQGDLCDLGTSADDDDALAEDLSERTMGFGEVDAVNALSDASSRGRIEVAQFDVEDARDPGLALGRREGVDGEYLGTGLPETDEDLDEIGCIGRAHADGSERVADRGNGEVGQVRVGQMGVRSFGPVTHGTLRLRHRRDGRLDLGEGGVVRLDHQRGGLYRQAVMTETITRSIATPQASSGAAIRVGIIGATGYVGGELIRILERHPQVRIAGLQGRERDGDPVADPHPHLGRTGHVIDSALPQVDAVFLALPHGAAAAIVPDLIEKGTRVIDLGADYRLRDATDYERWYDFVHPAPELLADAVYGLPELHRDELAELADRDVAIVGAPGCYPTTTLLGLSPLARAGLIGDLVVDAKSGVSGAGREPKAALTYAEVNESVRAYGVRGHRHVAELEQELQALGVDADANPGAHGVDFLPHLVPMTRGILSASHVRPTRPITSAELADLYDDAYGGERFVEVVDRPPTTGQVLGSNECRVYAQIDERTGRITTISVTDNLVKGAAGQAVQAFNVVFGLPESAGLEQLPLAP